MVIAKVNNYEIKEHEYRAELRNTLVRMKLEEANPDAKNAAINQLIDGYILLQTAKNNQDNISDEDIDRRFVEITMKFNSRDDFDKALEAQGLNEILLREQIGNELTIKNYISNNFTSEKEVEENKLKQLYQENLDSFLTQEMVKASHILVKNSEADSLRKITEIRQRINNSADFLEEAKECSDCPSCCNSGDLGYFTRGKMVKEFEDTAFDMVIGEISEPIETQFGFHIIMVTDRRTSKTATFEEVKETLQKRLQQIEKELSIVRHIKELRAKSEVEIFEERL